MTTLSCFVGTLAVAVNQDDLIDAKRQALESLAFGGAAMASTSGSSAYPGCAW